MSVWSAEARLSWRYKFEQYYHINLKEWSKSPRKREWWGEVAHGPILVCSNISPEMQRKWTKKMWKRSPWRWSKTRRLQLYRSQVNRGSEEDLVYFIKYQWQGQDRKDLRTNYWRSLVTTERTVKDCGFERQRKKSHLKWEKTLFQVLPLRVTRQWGGS